MNGQRRPQDPGSRRHPELPSPRNLGCGGTSAIFWVILAAAAGVWLWTMARDPATPPSTLISYSELIQQLRAGNVASVLVQEQQIRGVLVEPATTEVEGAGQVEYSDFVTYAPSFGDDQLMSLLAANEVRIDARPASDVSGWVLLLNFLPIILLFGLGFFLFTRMRGDSGGGGLGSILSMRQSGAQLYDKSQERVTFDDVAGLHGAKAELQEIVAFLKNPSYFGRLGGQVPHGVLLVGPPGTGKTLLARAVAGEADVPFFSITGSNFMEMLVGVGASRVRDLFAQATKSSSAIIFIDELDSIGRRRGAGLGGGHDEREQTLNQLLSEMDGFAPNQGVIVMAATNRPDILDPALMRPGRFDRRVIVELPTMKDRVEILRIHARNKPLARDVDLERLARGTPGFSGADLENLLNEAALLAARRAKDVIEHDDVEEARDKVLMGLARENLTMTQQELEMVAYHEAGHALVAALVPNTDPIHKVTIVPRGRAMGITQQLPERDRYIYRREYMLDRLAVMMGGRAAEELIYDTATSGAENDLKQATQLARRMVLDWGMSQRLGHMALGSPNEEVFLGQDIVQRRDFSEHTAQVVDQEIQAILKDAYRRASDMLRHYHDELDRIVDLLLEQEEIPGDKVVSILGPAAILPDQAVVYVGDEPSVELDGAPGPGLAAG